MIYDYFYYLNLFGISKQLLTYVPSTWLGLLLCPFFAFSVALTEYNDVYFSSIYYK